MVRHMEIIAFHRTVARRTGFQLAVVDYGFQCVAALGLLWAATRSAFRWLPLTFLALSVPIAFLYDRGVLEPWRHIYQTFPWMLFGLLFFLWSCAQMLRSWLRSDHPGVEEHAVRDEKPYGVETTIASSDFAGAGALRTGGGITSGASARSPPSRCRYCTQTCRSYTRSTLGSHYYPLQGRQSVQGASP